MSAILLKHKQLRDITRMLFSAFYQRKGITPSDLHKELLNNPVGHFHVTKLSVPLKTHSGLTINTQAMLTSTNEVCFDVTIASSHESIEFTYYLAPRALSNHNYIARKESPIIVINVSQNATAIFDELPINEISLK